MPYLKRNLNWTLIRSLVNCVPCVLKTFWRANVSCVLACLSCVRAHVSKRHVCACAHVPTCLACWRAFRAYVLTSQSAMCAHVLTCQRALRARMLFVQYFHASFWVHHILSMTFASFRLVNCGNLKILFESVKHLWKSKAWHKTLLLT